MKNTHAQKLGKLGGMVKSKRKANSSKKNGLRGGRPSTLGLSDTVLFFDGVDEVRRTGNTNPLFKMFVGSKRPRERALISASMRYLCKQMGKPTPPWAKDPIVLKQPYFVSGIENLKALSLLESPAVFSACNIFVLENFLSRV